MVQYVRLCSLLRVGLHIYLRADASMAGSDYSEALSILFGTGSVALYLETAGAAAENLFRALAGLGSLGRLQSGKAERITMVFF